MVSAMLVTMRTKPFLGRLVLGRLVLGRLVLDGRTATISSSAGRRDFVSRQNLPEPRLSRTLKMMEVHFTPEEEA